jgi:capsular polysaccharide export protein
MNWTDWLRRKLRRILWKQWKRSYARVIKHHPMDRGHRHYGELIKRLAERYGTGRRVIYAHELHLPTCLDHTLGVVLINSTVGLSSLLHNVPTKTLGQAMYDMPGLTCQKPLALFWRDPIPVDLDLYARYRNYLIEKPQPNGSFFGRFPLSD